MFNIVFMLLEIFFLKIFLIGKIADNIGPKKFKIKAIIKLFNDIDIFKSVFNSSFIISFIIFKTK